MKFETEKELIEYLVEELKYNMEDVKQILNLE